MQFHDDPLQREELILKYLLRKMPPDMLEPFESHFLECRECFEEVRITQLMMFGLGEASIRRRTLEDVTVLQFTEPIRLVRHSRALTDVYRVLLEQKERKVLIDLSKVSRIDSAGLGMLLACCSQALRNRGMLKLLRPTAEIGDLLRTTRTDRLLESYQDEAQAVRSF
jgi:anti-sigma B factor antagonist